MKMSKNKKDILLSIENKHSSSCGKSPDFVIGKDCRTFYFENDYGEQLVLIGNSEKADLWHGDVSWEEPFIEITKETIPCIFRQFTLSESERNWVLVCCHSIGINPK